MKKAIKKKWLKALRSGEYKQGSGVLRTPSGMFCCLGVLCELAVAEGVIPPPSKGGTYGDDVNGHSTIQLPISVVRWAFRKSETKGGELEDLGDPLIGRHLASHWNDNERKTFDEIADLIDEHL